ncbi:MAG: helix-turn-helix transcriptional regulator [Variibacter sp.]
MARATTIGKKRANSVPQLLYSRTQAAQALGGVSVSTIRRLEAAGRLTPVKLSPHKDGALVFYRVDEVQALADA